MSVFTNEVVVDNTVLVDGSAVTQPVSAATLPLPTGAATSANQGTGNTSLASIDAKTPALVGGRQPVDASGTNVTVVQATGTNLHVTVDGTVQTIGAIASTSTVTLVVSTGSNQTLLAANPSRKKAILWFENSTFQVKLGAVASTTSYTYKVSASNTGIEITNWAGQIDAIGTANKNILVTELS